MKKTGSLIKFAGEVLKIEADSVRFQLNHLNLNFTRAAKTILSCSKRGNRLVITGVGKSGLIGRKLAATFSSLGIASIFVHPTEMIHGDLGTLVDGDVVMLLSYSGESDELKKIFPALKEFKLASIALTGNSKSSIARLSDCGINVSVDREACCYNLVPTSSTTAMLAMGDALALSAARLRGFRKEDFARLHPGGSLGRRLTLKVGSIMRSGNDIPVVRETASVRDALDVMTAKKLGAVIVVNSKGLLTGYFTDGDLRRKIPADPYLLKKNISRVMTKNPRVVGPEEMAADVAEIFKEFNFDNIPVVDLKGRPVGILDERDLIASGII